MILLEFHHLMCFVSFVETVVGEILLILCVVLVCTSVGHQQLVERATCPSSRDARERTRRVAAPLVVQRRALHPPPTARADLPAVSQSMGEHIEWLNKSDRCLETRRD